MGGRGGSGSSRSGGFEGVKSRLPSSLDFDIRSQKLPELSGSEKQIKWAQEIRTEIVQELSSYATRFTSDGRPSTAADTFLKGKDAMMESIKSNQLIALTSGSVRNEKINNEINSYMDAKSRLERLYKVAKNTSAKFWIDNRTNQIENHMNRKLKRIIDGK